jgi:hypothetical protein
MVLIVLGPLLFFAPQLSAAKHEGLLAFGGLAERYVRGFEAKWLPGDAAGDEALLGSADIQSQADLARDRPAACGCRPRAAGCGLTRR